MKLFETLESTFKGKNTKKIKFIWNIGIVLFSIRFLAIFDYIEWRTTWILRGCSKPLYEAPDPNCNRIGQSGHQIGDNFIPKSNLVSIQFNFQWKVIHQKLSEQALVSWSGSVTRQLRNRLFWHQKYPKIRWKSLVLTKEKTKIITLSNQATAQPLGKIQ